MSFVLDYLGRVHPLLIHAPITLLLLGGLIELCRLRTPSAFLAESAVWVFGLGAWSALAAAASGWLLAKQGRHDPDLHRFIELHRWFGLTTTLVAVVAWLCEVAWTSSGSAGQVWTRRSFAWAASLFTIVTGHLGAVIVWGADWFS